MATFTEVSEGLALLARHLEKGLGSGVTAQGGRLFAPDATEKYLPPLSAQELERLGWVFDGLAGCWALQVESTAGLLQGDASKPRPQDCDSL
jgi:hypothetical protein